MQASPGALAFLLVSESASDALPGPSAREAATAARHGALAPGARHAGPRPPAMPPRHEQRRRAAARVAPRARRSWPAMRPRRRCWRRRPASRTCCWTWRTGRPRSAAAATSRSRGRPPWCSRRWARRACRRAWAWCVPRTHAVARQPLCAGGAGRRTQPVGAPPRSPGPSTRWRALLAARRRALEQTATARRATAARPQRARTTPAARPRPPGRCCTGWLRTWRARAARCRCAQPPAMPRGTASDSDGRLCMPPPSVLLLHLPHVKGRQAAMLVLCGASMGIGAAKSTLSALMSSGAPEAHREPLETALAVHI